MLTLTYPVMEKKNGFSKCVTDVRQPLKVQADAAPGYRSQYRLHMDGLVRIETLSRVLNRALKRQSNNLKTVM